MNVSKPRVHFDGLFGGDKEIGRCTLFTIKFNKVENANQFLIFPQKQKWQYVIGKEIIQ